MLQLAVGTVNLYGAANAGLNVVTTFRQPAGATLPGGSATLLNSPTITLPAAIGAGAGAGANAEGFDPCSTAAFGASGTEVGTTAITSTSQASGTNCGATQTTFGQSGGVFGLGIEPYNAFGQGDYANLGCQCPGNDGTPFQVAPYPVPIYDTTAADPNQLPAAWGGPPAFSLVDSGGDSPVGNGLYPTGTAGLSLGIDVFQGVPAVAGGAYTLSVAIPANTGTVTSTKSFTMPAALTNLGTAAAPAYVPDGLGGGTFAFVMPAGATDAYVEITDYGPDTAPVGSTTYPGCNGSGTGIAGPPVVGNGTGTPIFYTLHATASGTLTLPDTIGPGGSPTICTAALNTTANAGNTPAATSADQIAIQVIAGDYPMYASAYPQSAGVAAPAIITGTSSDLTISPAVCQEGVGVCTDPLPLLRARHNVGHATSTGRTLKPAVTRRL
ncbi:MAG: hypothetical protein ABSE64_07625 [Vulcanimicrobiaceae bacterium]